MRVSPAPPMDRRTDGRTHAPWRCSSSYAGTNQIKFAVPAVRSAVSARHTCTPERGDSRRGGVMWVKGGSEARGVSAFGSRCAVQPGRHRLQAR
ncbi:hypothetical protein NS331_03745 [Pseudacidovorax intermedius]|uniref:Uncharacterized protein n=1 Tax=Pseudacidovorax intermedius TaxID=433924 RepID=A0A147H9G3_9BURK|nr:hypothetical protein NS331_03745 [Pseudacidovorax intermedius]